MYRLLKPLIVQVATSLHCYAIDNRFENVSEMLLPAFIMLLVQSRVDGYNDEKLCENLKSFFYRNYLGTLRGTH